MSTAGGRLEFGTDLDAAVEHWDGYRDVPEAIATLHAIRDALVPLLGAVSNVYITPAGQEVVVKFERLEHNVLYVNVGFIDIYSSAMAELARRGVDVVECLGLQGLSVTTTEWANGRVAHPSHRETTRRRAIAVERRECSCSPGLQQMGDVCMYCEEPLASTSAS
jgi:hypothetical protein